MPSHPRPLSPHLQIYRWQLTSVLSILHRLTGVALAVGALLLVWWIVAVALGPKAFAFTQDFLGSIVGRILLFAWSWSMFYHLGNGIRHLCWDAGLGFDLKVAYRTGWIVVAASFILTVVAWLAGYSALGGAI